ncbi:endothelin-converting enzyme homolog [Hydractinia symbiolongicarpus]|uniref:endothelin-converting enzyme homolog n=1 Tax=Hydractinia symbiolongicarpus TaxID=13093 RepID=UPI00254A206D|nr:endothelin-converting enzyme homolog [Hydractinia symbiolongicarpus]
MATDDVKSPLHKKSLTNNNHFAMNEAYVRKPRNERQTILVIVLFFLLLLLLVLLIVMVTLYVNKDSKMKEVAKKHKTTVCSTRDCVQISARIIEAMDHKVSPCENFYQYACGGWLHNTPIPDSRTRYSRFQKLSEQNSVIIKKILNDLNSGQRNASTPALDKASIYYHTCMDTKTIEKLGDKPMLELVEKLGSWPVTNSNFNASSWDLMEAMVQIHRNISQAPVFNLYVAGDIKNSTENVIVFDQSGLSMSKDSYLLNTTYHAKNRNAYRKMVKEIVKLMGANETGIRLMDEVYEFEKQLAEITMSVMERRDYRLIYKTMTLAEFANQTEIPEKWLSEFVNKIFGGVNVPLSERIVSFNVEYIKKAFKLFTALRPDIQASYVIWQAVKVMAPVVLGKYQDVTDDYFMTAFGTKDRQPRWEICIGSTLGAFGYALSRSFVEEVYDRTAKTMSTEMIQAIKGVFTDNLEQMDWMDAKTKKYARKKAEKILENIGYPDFILNSTALEQEYIGLEVEKGQHFDNYMTRRKYKNFKNYKKRGKPVDKSEWGILPTTVNAYYAPTENKIGFPAGILQWPFYDKRAPRAVAYGAIGMVVGHEITHGFDDQGKDFTIEGNFDTWWTNHSLTQFKQKSQCFINQYSNFTLFNKKMNGAQTLGEDLADNGGLRQALQAYRHWVSKNGEEDKLPGLDLTPEQLYFLAFAQVWCTAYRESAAINQIETGVHSLSMFRVIGTLQNSEDFSKAYKCPVASPMNPVKKCRIW